MIKKTLLVTLLIVSCSLGAMAQGTLTLGQKTGVGCQPGYSCQNFSVTAPGIPNYSGTGAGMFGIRRSVTGASGTVVFFPAADGTQWSVASNPLGAQLQNRLLAQNYDIIQVRWSGNGWVTTPPGVVVSQAVLAQLPATILQWLKPNRARGQRYIVAGLSNGSSQIAYSMAYYNAAPLVDTAIIMAGPPYMELDVACGTDWRYQYTYPQTSLIDKSYGYVNNPTGGPCYNRDPSWFGFEHLASVESGTSYYYPTTSVKILLGALDTLPINKRGQDYFNLLSSKGTRSLSLTYVSNTPHGIIETQEGMDALYSAITQR